MTIILNNTPEQLPGEFLTIKDILRIKNFSFPNLVVKINGTLVKKPFYDQTTVKAGDNVEIIHLISGG
ncbi:MAG: sulfur carrier protein ThiS [Bacteroidota bacterium]